MLKYISTLALSVCFAMPLASSRADAHHCARPAPQAVYSSSMDVDVPFIEAPLVFATGLAEFGVSIPEYVLLKAVPVPYVGRIPSPYHP